MLVDFPCIENGGKGLAEFRSGLVKLIVEFTLLVLVTDCKLQTFLYFNQISLYECFTQQLQGCHFLFRCTHPVKAAVLLV